METATFGAGCFWGVEGAFQELKGVTATAVGYMGGSVKNATYKQVCTDRTGHAEVCQVTFDPAVIRYEKLVEVFFKIHDPTTKNRQGPDAGSQYRSAIFFHTPEQEKTAHAIIEKVQTSGKFKRPVVTEIVPANEFWRAEEYHQKYFKKQGLPSCHVVTE